MYLLNKRLNLGLPVSHPKPSGIGREIRRLTTLEAIEFLEIIQELEQALLDLGDWDFAEEYCDPRELVRAKKEL